MDNTDINLQVKQYSEIFPEIKTVLDYSETGNTYFAIGELNRLRRKTTNMNNPNLNTFWNGLEEFVYGQGTEKSLEYALEGARMDADKDVDFYVHQARDFKSHVPGMDIEKRIVAIIWVLRRR